MTVERVEVTDEDPDIIGNAGLDAVDLAELEAERRDHAEHNPGQVSSADNVIAEVNPQEDATLLDTQENQPEIIETRPAIVQGIEFSPEALAGLFQKLLDEDPENAINTMRENLADGIEAEKITPKFQEILNKILDDVESVAPEQQAQAFKDAVENSPELKDEAANVLLLMDSANDQVSSLLQSGNPIAILFAVLSMVAGVDNKDFMSAMNDVMEELGVDMKPIEDAQASTQADPEQPEAVAQNEPQIQPSEDEQVTTQAGVEGDALEEEVAQVDTTALTGYQFSGSDSVFQGDDNIRSEAVVALSDVGVSTAGIEGLEQGMPADQLEQTAAYNPLAPA